MGGLLAGLLARAGSEVAVVARGTQFEVLRKNGIRVDSPLGVFSARVASISDDPALLAPCDAVLVAVKAWQVVEAGARLGPLVATGAAVVPLQNGVEAAEQLSALLGRETVAGGVIKCLAWVDRPGVVKHVGQVPEVIVGERGARATAPSPRLLALAAELDRAGVMATVAEDIERAVWEKFLLVEPWGALASAARAPIGVLRSLPVLRDLLLRALEEVVALGRARGVNLAADAAAQTVAFIDTLPPEGTVSMQRDVGAGRPSELEDQVGAVVRLARAAKVPTPIHDVLYAALAAQEASARGRIPRFPRT